MLALLSLSVVVLAVTADTAGWPDLFPELTMFHRKVAAPMVARGDRPQVYSQSVTYEWTGGRYEVLTITIARDAAFKEKYADEAVKKARPAPEVVEVNRKRAYLWDRKKPDDLEKVNKRLVVVLADDKVLIVEQIGFGLELPETAKKLNFDKVVKALESPPPSQKPVGSIPD